VSVILAYGDVGFDNETGDRWFFREDHGLLVQPNGCCVDYQMQFITPDRAEVAYGKTTLRAERHNNEWICYRLNDSSSHPATTRNRVLLLT